MHAILFKTTLIEFQLHLFFIIGISMIVCCLHFKFNNIGAAAELVLDMYRYQESFPIQKDRKELQKHCLEDTDCA